MTGCVHCGLPLPSDRAEYCCVGCRIAAAVARPAGDGSGLSRQGLKLGFGLFIAVNLMAVSGVFYAADLFGEAATARGSMTALTDLFAYLMLLLATLVVALLGLPLAEDAFARRPGPVPIDAQRLIVLGVLAAYAVSVWNTVRGDGRLYFDTAAMVLVLLIFGRWVEARARRRVAEGRASALDGLPQRAVVERDGTTLELDVEEIVAGDRVRVRAGECAVVDGTVVRGVAHVDARALTGESRPLPRAEGDELLAGSTAIDGELWVVARRIGTARTVAGIERLLDEARRNPPPIQRIADRFARVFTPLVTGIALLVLIVGLARGNFEEGLMRGLSVLLIACPCALGFAAPVAVAAAMRRAAERGIVFDSAAVLESTARLKRVFFDKTGTLTTAAAEVLSVENVSSTMSDAEVLELLASLEAGFTHPLARGIAAHARERGARPRPTERSRVLPGLGIEGFIDGRRYALGNRRLVGGDAPTGSELLLVGGDEVLARIEVADRVRPEASATLASLGELSIVTAGLSGDATEAADKLGTRLGMPIEGELLPADKVERVAAARREQLEGVSVGMVGDGLNDAAVLAAADVGFVLSSATDLARQSGNVHLIDDRLDAVPEAVTMARHTYRRIALALSWAFAYNAVGVVLAAMGRLGPAFAASAMILSSLLVLALVGGAGGSRPEDETAGGELVHASRVGPS